DEREAVADKRERAANQRQEQIAELIGELRGLVSGAHRDALEAIERSRALLLAPAGRGARAEEGARRADDRRRRGQAAIARAAGYGERQLAHPLVGGQGPAGYARAMRIRLAATAAAFAAAEESTGSLFDQLAAAHPSRAGAYHRRARPGKPATPRTAPATSPANSTANPPPAPSPAARDAPVGAGQQRYLTATHGQLSDQASPPSARPRRGSRHSRVTPEGASFEVWTGLGEQRA